MVNRSKNIGTAFETECVRFLRRNGWPNCERRALAGSADLGDIVGMPGIAVECKGGAAAERSTPADLLTWQAQTDAEVHNSNAEVGVLVTKRKGVGAVNAGAWWAWMRLSHLLQMRAGHTDPDSIDCWVRMELREAVWLLRWSGYGTPFSSDR